MAAAAVEFTSGLHFDTFSRLGRQNASAYQISCKSVNISQSYDVLYIFKMTSVRHLEFWKIEILEVEVKICVSTQNLVKIGWSAAEILQWNRNPIWPPLPPCWIYFRFTFWHFCKIRKTNCVSIPNFVQNGQYFAKLWRFVYFQDGFRPPSWILKNWNFG